MLYHREYRRYAIKSSTNIHDCDWPLGVPLFEADRSTVATYTCTCTAAVPWPGPDHRKETRRTHVLAQ